MPNPNGPGPFKNLGDSFFDGANQATLMLDLQMGFGNDPDNNRIEIPDARSFTLVRSQPDAIIADFFIQLDEGPTDELRAVTGQLPDDLQLITETDSQTETTLHLGIYSLNPTTGSYTGLACGPLDSLANSHFSGLTSEIVDGHRRYILTAAAGSVFHDLLDEDAGTYQVRVSSQPCNGLDLSPLHRTDFIITPSQGVAIRFHYRDLLGSSALSRLYSHRMEGSEPGATIDLDLAGGPLTLYPHPAERTFYEPFGSPITGTAGETRYTDHERDPNSGFNYMKGRYQLPEQFVFNRPDPKRDWDWLRPNTINLYQYTSNDPINAWDPDGFGTRFELDQLRYAKAELDREDEIGPEAAKAERQESRKVQLAIAGIVIPIGVAGLTGGGSAILTEIADAGLELVGINIPISISDGVEFLAKKGIKNIDKLSSVTPMSHTESAKIVGGGVTGNSADDLVFRSASGTPTSMTPRPKDTKGLSSFNSLENALPGKNQVIDTKKLQNLCANCDNPSTGHVSITPKDMTQMQGWINSRGSDKVHPLTQELMDAVVD